MYTMTRQFAFVDAARIERLRAQVNETAPGLGDELDFTLTDTPERASAKAMSDVSAILMDPSYRYEYAKLVKSVTFDEKGINWTVEVLVSGD